MNQSYPWAVYFLRDESPLGVARVVGESPQEVSLQFSDHSSPSSDACWNRTKVRLFPSPQDAFRDFSSYYPPENPNPLERIVHERFPSDI